MHPPTQLWLEAGENLTAGRLTCWEDHAGVDVMKSLLTRSPPTKIWNVIVHSIRGKMGWILAHVRSGGEESRIKPGGRNSTAWIWRWRRDKRSRKALGDSPYRLSIVKKRPWGDSID
jgi:hypothetical protein